jgi:hypothetical protein
MGHCLVNRLSGWSRHPITTIPINFLGSPQRISPRRWLLQECIAIC